MTQFAPQMNQPPTPQGIPFPTMQLPFAGGNGQTQPQFPTPQFPMPQFPMPQLPSFAFPQFPNAQQQSMPSLPLPTPFIPFPQPYVLHEQALKNTIELLRNLLAQSEAARGAANFGVPTNPDQQNTPGPLPNAPIPGPGPLPNAPMPSPGLLPNAPMPGPGCQQIPMPQTLEQQKANETGMLPRNDFLGNILGNVFGASNTDYFYED